jgi:hypothetical protein
MPHPGGAARRFSRPAFTVGQSLSMIEKVHGIADMAVGHDHVLAEDAFLRRAEFQDGGAAADVSRVGLVLDAVEFQRLEGMAHQQEFALGIDRAAPDGGSYQVEPISSFLWFSSMFR